MSKRKLTKQQTWRIERIHKERVERTQKRGDIAEELLQSSDLGPETEGIIISHFGTQVEVEGTQEPFVGISTRCNLRANLGQLVTGDKVIWRPKQNEGGVVVATTPRNTSLSRPDMHGRIKPVAANIDHIIVVIAAEPVAHANLIDRYLVAAETVGIPPVILLNKCDLIDESNKEELDALIKTYEDLNYTIIRTSIKNQAGMEALYNFLQDKTSVFVGQSGVGKSSLIGTLLPGIDISVGELSQKRKKGVHTTTTARLFHMPKGGDLIDSPGIREFGLWHISEEELLNGFIEFRPHIGYCRFRDCAHEKEPGCAILGALEEGKITEHRFQSFLRIKQSIRENQAF
ncbi:MULTISPECIES: small ribosomal subunit biogenesis GTPase RsgA [Marinomonas]|uniref:Small ribosomal subunit biogenesis GTPase RsgA n=1 Tax=Marinomonas arctica TaxID=383750 RepID=A0A7H1J1U0_9GAMM|nr:MULTISPECIES: small ribosomal subunit biogenesis GTPase RsgA [Marinomonas]MCS7487918.1 GTPase RsgA [Marinomonas sp. BSi20414]QNT04456.1 small ribosomal subunit biogenesis GTPase RsgA [Marinomonas arctica]GGN32012.1 putative ribosome biogenesis GTPase RsgA [Marinomonas arctica]